MNINLEKLYAEMKNRPWNGGIQSILANLRSKKLIGNFPIPFVKVKSDKSCGVGQLPREDFPIFGIDPKTDFFDLVQCSKCNISYRLQNVEQHLEDHVRILRNSSGMGGASGSQSISDSPESFSSNSLPSTPTKAAKKEMPKTTVSVKKFLSSSSPPDVVIPSTDVSSDPDSSSSGFDLKRGFELQYGVRGFDLQSGGGGGLSVKTELDASSGMGVPSSNNSCSSTTSSTTRGDPVNFTSSIKSKHIVLDKLKKANNKADIKDSTRRTQAAPSAASKQVKEFDPNKHCGVCTEDNGWTPCLRSLTCKSHAISLRRAVPGRCKTFDELLLEHKQSKGSKTLSSMSLASKHTKKKSAPAKDVLVTLQQAIVTPVTVLLTPLATPPSPTPVKQEIKEEPMQVEEPVAPAQPPPPRFKLELTSEPATPAPLPVIECTTRVRRLSHQPQPLGVARQGSLCLSQGRMFTSPTEAYWMKLLSANVIQSSGLTNTININSIKKTLYPAQFFNLMSSSSEQTTTPLQTGGNFVPMSNGRYTFTQRGNPLNEQCKQQHNTIVKNLSLLGNFS
uniref:Ataxin-7-like protein 1 n=1 Tax=Cacopsylla melanoneura TaxID=428564 RepID=A0A8D8LHF2_9HEMI